MMCVHLIYDEMYQTKEVQYIKIKHAIFQILPSNNTILQIWTQMVCGSQSSIDNAHSCYVQQSFI